MSESSPEVDGRVRKYASIIWDASRKDEGTISATGADFVAKAVIQEVDSELAEAEDSESEQAIAEQRRSFVTNTATNLAVAGQQPDIGVVLSYAEELDHFIVYGKRINREAPQN